MNNLKKIRTCRAMSEKYLLTVSFFTNLTKPCKWYKRISTIAEHQEILETLRHNSLLFEYTSIALIDESGKLVREHLSSNELTLADITDFLTF